MSIKTCHATKPVTRSVTALTRANDSCDSCDRFFPYDAITRTHTYACDRRGMSEKPVTPVTPVTHHLEENIIMNHQNIAGLDLSLTSTGIALSTPNGITTHRIQTKPTPTGPLDGKGKATQTYDDKLGRFQLIKALIAGRIPRSSHVFLEGPSYASPQGVHDLAGNWWGVYEHLLAHDCAITVIPPSNVKKYATGKGGGKDAGKDNVLAAAIRRYPNIDINGNDIADATILLAIGHRLTGQPLEQDLPKANLDALTKLQLPATEDTPA